MSFVGKVRTPWSNLKNHKALFQIPGENKKELDKIAYMKRTLFPCIPSTRGLQMFLRKIKRRTTRAQRCYSLTIVYQVT